MNILFLDWPCFGRTDFLNFFSERHDSVTLFSHADYELRKSDSFLAALYSVLENQQFDFCFSYNFFPLMATACYKCNIKYISFVYDSPQVKLYSYTVTYPTNYIFLFDSYLVEQFQKEGLTTFYYMPLPVNADRIHSLLQKPYDSARLSADVSFVGSLYNENHNLYDSLQGISSYTKGYLDAIMQAQSHVYGYNFLEEILPDSIVEEFRNSLEGFYTPPTGFRRNDRATMAQLYLGAKVTAMERLWLMQTLGSKYSVNLYTASDTTGLSVHNCGLAKTLTEMPLIFHFSKINLNPTAKSIQTGLPLRLFDVLACEGFLLTNYQSELTDYFTPGQELECYTGEDDLLSKTEYYLTHENDRKEIAHNGYLALEKYHNYPERLLQMISLAYGLDAI